MDTVELKYHWKEAADQRSRRNSAKVATIILHSTDGHCTGDIDTLTGVGGREVSVHWYTTKAGEIWHFVDNSRCAYHAGVVDVPAHDNDHTIGIEQEHIDGEEPWPDALVKATALVVAYLRQEFGAVPAISHAVVARPVGRKVDPMNYPWDKLHDFVAQLQGKTITAVRL